MDYLDSVNNKKAEKASQQKEEFLHKQSLAVSKQNTKEIVDTLKEDAKTIKKVKIEDIGDLASKKDIDSVIKQLKENQLATLLGNQKSSGKPAVVLANGTDVEDIMAPLASKIDETLKTLIKDNSNRKAAEQLDKSFKDFAKALSLHVTKQQEIARKSSEDIQDAISSLDLRPVVNVPQPKVTVNPSNDVNLDPLLKKLEAVDKSIKTISMPSLDNTEMTLAIDSVRNSIENLVFPTANYILPYAKIDGSATQVTLSSTGRIPVELGVSPTIDIGDVQVKDASGNVINPSTKENQTSGAQKTQITDSSGTANTMKTIGTAITASDYALVTNTVIHGETAGGGGGFVDVKVTPSGALTVEATLSTPDTGTVTTASVTNSNTTVLASNNQRLGATIYNEGSVTALVKLGSTASATSYTVKIITDAYYEVPNGYTGIITGITASGTATLRVTELT